MDNLIDEIAKSLAGIEGEGDYVAFSDSRYRAIPFSRKNFHTINDVDSDKSIAFVDGGNCEVIKTPNLSVHLVRAAFVIYQKGKKITQKRIDSFAISKYVAEKDAYAVRIPGLMSDEIVFSTFDETIREGPYRASISKMGEVARRFLEIRMAEEAIKLLAPGDYLVRDGTLQTSVTGEGRFLNDLYSLASEKRINLCALAKTSSLLTKKGNNAVTALLTLAPAGKWVYHPIAEINHPDHLAHMHFSKLHASSRYIFRVEFYKKSNCDIEEAFSLLSSYSNDAQLPGYPYGLIAVDRLAKVEEKEAAVYRTKILAKLGSGLESGINSLNAHEWF